MRRHDKPIHGSCAIYFPGGIGVSSLHFRYLKCLVIIYHLAKIPPVGNDSKDEKMSPVIHNVEYNPEMEIVDNESSLFSRQLYNQLIEWYLENKLLLISINFTPKTSHCCQKKSTLCCPGIWISSAWQFSVSVFWDG